MAGSAQPPNRRRICFGVFQLDPLSGELFRQGLRVKLQDQPFQVLLTLLERPGELVTREELRDRIWGADTFVEFDHSLNISINKLRDALGDTAANPRFIETVPRRGYRFLAPVRVEGGAAPVVTPAPAPSEAAIAPPPVAPASRSWLPWIIAAGLAVALALGGWYFTRSPAAKPADSGRVMLAVLPFEDLTADHEQAYFLAGLNDEMIAQLGRLHPEALGVIARTSVAQYAANRKPARQIADELHVEYLLDGSVRHMGDHFRVTASLIRASNQNVLWSETYDRSLGDMLSLQEDVARHVAQAVAVEFSPVAEQQLKLDVTPNAAAYQAYLRGRYLWFQETSSSLMQAIAQFQESIRIDSNYAPAYVGLANTYNLLGSYGFMTTGEAAPKAKAAAARALELAPNLSDAHVAVAWSAFYQDMDFAAAESAFRRALALNPNNPDAHTIYAEYLHAMGRFTEAAAENRAAEKLDPLNPWVHDDRGWLLLDQGQPAQAAEAFRRACEVSPAFPAGHLSLASAYAQLGRYADGLAEVEKARTLQGAPTRVLEVEGVLQARAGNLAAARAVLEKLKGGNIGGRVSPYSLAAVYNALGEKDQAIAALEAAYRERDGWVVWIKVLRDWDGMRADPRFTALLQEMNLQTSR